MKQILVKINYNNLYTKLFEFRSNYENAFII